MVALSLSLNKPLAAQREKLLAPNPAALYVLLAAIQLLIYFNLETSSMAVEGRFF